VQGIGTVSDDTENYDRLDLELKHELIRQSRVSQVDPMMRKYEKNDWAYSEDPDQDREFVHLVLAKLNEVEQRMLLCLIDRRVSTTLLRDSLYR